MFGGLCCTVWCGVSRENGIQEALRIVNDPFLSLSLFSLLLFSNGVWFYLLFLVFPFLGYLLIVLWFLDVFAFLVHFLCTGLCFFNILLSYLSKKRNRAKRYAFFRFDFQQLTCSKCVFTSSRKKDFEDCIWFCVVIWLCLNILFSSYSGFLFNIYFFWFAGDICTG